jgi:hypothetical protein
MTAKDWQAADWHRLWLSIWAKKRHWRSLALVPAGPGLAPDKLRQIAITLANSGSVYAKKPIHVADATGILTQQQRESFSTDLAHYVGHSELVVIVLPALADSALSLDLAKAADCALLCVVRGEMASADAKKTIAKIGAPHFIGSALFQLAPDHDAPTAGAATSKT